MKEADSDDIDRLSIPVRPQSVPIMRKHWGKLLFMHWPVPAERLRPSIPRGIRSNMNLFGVISCDARGSFSSWWTNRRGGDLDRLAVQPGQTHRFGPYKQMKSGLASAK